MKKTFLLIAVLLTIGGSVFAQQKPINLGVKVGYQTSKLSYQQADIQASFQNNLTFGVFGRVNIDRIYLQPEIMYFKTGNIFALDMANTSEGWIPSEQVTFTLNEANLQVPVLIGFKPQIPLLDNFVSLRAQVGPTANFTLASSTLFDQTFTLTNNEEETVTLEETDEVFDTKTIAWGFQAGIGADILDTFTLDINYNFGLSKVFGALNNTSLNNYFDFSNVDDSKQSLFMVTVGYKFL